MGLEEWVSGDGVGVSGAGVGVGELGLKGWFSGVSGVGVNHSFYKIKKDKLV